MERLVKYFVPERYELDLFVDKHQKTIGGTVKVTGEAKAETVKFDAVGLEIKEVKIGEKQAKFEVADDILTVLGAKKGEKATIYIIYSGKLNENMQGAYLSTYEYNGKKEVLVATQFESHYAREAFPCIDEPGAKAEFVLNISIPEEDKDDIVIANTSHDSKQHLEAKASSSRAGMGSDSSWRTFSFQPTPRMSTYLLAFVIGRLQGKTIKNAHGTEITTYTTLAQDIEAVDFANEIAAKSLEYYDDKFGVPYPLKKLDQVALPDFEAGAMENWGLVTYRESMMLAPKTATIATKKSVALTVAHELSHQWFGDLVTMEWWDDLWLNESFASIMEYYAVDFIHPEYQIFEGFFTGDCYAALVRDAYTDVQSVHQDVTEPAEIATLFDGAIVYSKGAHLMLMLIRAMGLDEFFAGCREYFEKHKYGNTVGDDLWNALNKHAQFDTKALMHSFIDRPGYPVFDKQNWLQLETIGDQRGAIRATETRNDGLEGARRKCSQFAYQQKRFLLDGEMKKSDWPVPEVTDDMSGHYVISLSDEEFSEKLAKFQELSLEEKLRMLIDRSLVTRTELAPSSSLIPLVWEFRDENSAAVWGIVATILGNLKIFFKDRTSEEKKFKEFVKKLIAPKLGEIGLVTRKNDDENTIRLRAILLGMDYYAECWEDESEKSDGKAGEKLALDEKKDLKALAKMYEKDLRKMDAEIREDILTAKAYLEPETAREFMKMYEAEVDPEIKYDLLYAGTLVRDKETLRALMEFLDKPEIVKPQDQLYLFIYLYRNPLVREEMWAYMTENWAKIGAMMGEKTMDSYPRLIANVMRTEKELGEYREFFGDKREDAVLKRAIKIGEKEIEARIRLIRSDEKQVHEALDEFLKNVK